MAGNKIPKNLLAGMNYKNSINALIVLVEKFQFRQYYDMRRSCRKNATA